MKRRVTRGLGFILLAGACACGLDTSGLLDVDGSTDARFTGEGGVIDGTALDMGMPDDGGGQSPDSNDQPDVGDDVVLEGATDGRADTGPVPPVDARVEAASDGPVDAPRDVMRVDGPVDAPVDAPPDSGALPIVYDGGTIADPQFFDVDWVSFCSTLAACGEVPSVSGCVARLQQPSSPDALIPPFSMVSAVNMASPNCASVALALGDGSSCPPTTPDTCLGNSQVTCRWGFKMTIDCGGLGMVCSNGNGNAGCGFGDCALSQEGATYCVGPDHVAQCLSGRYAPLLDCFRFVATCVGPAGTAQCQGTSGTACTPGTAATCSGTSIVPCLDGQLGGFDCTTFFDPTFTCFPGNTGAPICAAGATCDPATYMDTCVGMNQVSFCNAGVVAMFNCRANAWNRCVNGICAP